MPVHRTALLAFGPEGVAARRPESQRDELFAASILDRDAPLARLPDMVAAAAEALRLEPETIVDFLVLRPLALGKIVELPRMRESALRRLVDANRDRLFPMDPADWTVDCLKLGRGRGDASLVLVTALPLRVVSAVESAVANADLRLGRMIPAPPASAVHARTLSRHGVVPAGAIINLELPGYRETVRLRRTLPHALIPGTADTRLPSLPATEGEEFACSMLERGWPLALELADAAARARRIPQPLGEAGRARRRQEARRRSGALVAVALLTVLLGFGLLIADQQRELRSLRDWRAELAPDVEEALRQRVVLRSLEGAVGVLSEAERRRTSWLRLFHDLAAALPMEMHATQVSGTPDSLHLTVAGNDSSGANWFLSVERPFEVVSSEGRGQGSRSLLVRWRDVAEGGRVAY